MYERKFKVKNISDIFLVINVKNENIGLPPKSEVEVLAKDMTEIAIPDKSLVEVTPVNPNEKFIDMGDHYVKVNMKGEVISGEFIKISKEDALDFKVKMLEEKKEKLENNIKKDLKQAIETLKEATKEETKDDKKEEPKKEELNNKVEETKKTSSKRRGRKPKTEKSEKE